jgi:hypothetical protein
LAAGDVCLNQLTIPMIKFNYEETVKEVEIFDKEKGKSEPALPPAGKSCP